MFASHNGPINLSIDSVHGIFFVLMLNVPVNNFSVMSGQATASWESKCVFLQGHNTAEVGIEPLTSHSGVRDSTTRPPRYPHGLIWKMLRGVMIPVALIMEDIGRSKFVTTIQVTSMR